MIPIHKSLQAIRTGFTRFEKNQVLTHEQLNGVAEYADDQLRLSRVKLSGVGLASGLRVSLVGNVVTLSPGLGISTDGDLFSLDSSVSFSSFKSFDASRPDYLQFHKGGQAENGLLTLYELLQTGTQDSDAIPLSSFAAKTGLALSAMTAVLYMESYVQDDDACSSTDCDNLGQELRNIQRLLLLPIAQASQLLSAPSTPHQAFAAMSCVSINRPILSSSITGPTALSQVFAPVITSASASLSAAVAQAYTALSPFVSGLFATSPVAGWQGQIKSVSDKFVSGGLGYLYCYDWLKDLAETVNTLRDAVLDDHTWLCTNPELFPKHLLLGDLVPGTDPEARRTGFYPSPVTSPHVAALERVRFLLRKLNAQIHSLSISPSATLQIRITPSHFEDHSLEDRALPIYYSVSPQDPASVHQVWSQRRSRRGESATLPGYNAKEYSSDPAVVSPLRVQIGAYAYFRVEGHVGWNVDAALTELEGQIASKNLPFVVEIVHVGSDPTKVKVPLRPYTDLHRLHNLFRQDLVSQLDDVDNFGRSMKTRVDSAVDSKVLSSVAADNDNVDVKQVASEKSSALTNKVSSTKSSLTKSYSAFKADTTWRGAVTDTMQVSGELQQSLSPVTKNEFLTPVDSFLGSHHLRWLDMLDKIIEHKETQQSSRKLLSSFVQEHHGAEHIAGVLRGGTFVLLYDDRGLVIGDLALPYLCCQPVQTEESEPVFEPRPLRPDLLLNRAITLQPSRGYLAGGIADAKVLALKQEVTPKLDAQDSVLSIFQQSSSLLNTTVSNLSNTYNAALDATFTKTYTPTSSYPINTGDTIKTGDLQRVPTSQPAPEVLRSAEEKARLFRTTKPSYVELDLMADKLAVLQKERVMLENKLADATATGQATESLEMQLKELDSTLGRLAGDTAVAIAAGGTEALKSTEGQRALTGASTVMVSLTPDTQKAVTNQVTDLLSTVETIEVKDALNTLTRV